MALFQINPNKVGKDWHALVRIYQGTGFQPVNVWANEMTYKRGALKAFGDQRILIADDRCRDDRATISVLNQNSNATVTGLCHGKRNVF